MVNELSTSTGTASRAERAWGSELLDILRPEARPVSYDMLFKDPKDGCARYDDVWGA